MTKTVLDFNIDTLLSDLIQYIESHNGYKLEAQQIEVLKNLLDFTIHNKIICTGRGLGKSTLGCGFALWLTDCFSTMLGEPVNVLLCSHQNVIYDYLETYFQNDSSLTERLKIKGFSRSFPEEGIIWKDNNSHLYIRLDTSRQIRGFHTWVVLLDESQAVDRNLIIQDIRKCATEKIAQFVMIGTPKRDTYFGDVLEGCLKQSKKYADWKLSQYSTEGVERLRARIESDANEFGRNSEEYITEVLATLPTQENLSPFKQYLKNCKCDLIEASNDLGSYNTMGLDLGTGLTHRNPCGVVLLQKHKNKKKSKVFYREKCDPIWSHFIEIITQNKVQLCLVDFKPKELSELVKAEVMPYCKTTKFCFIDWTNRKGSGENHLVDLMKVKGNLEIPSEFKDLYHEANHYYREKKEDKNLIDALILSAWEDSTTALEPEASSRIVIGSKDGSGRVWHSWEPNKYLHARKVKCCSCPSWTTIYEDPNGRDVYCSRCYDKKFGKKENY